MNGLPIRRLYLWIALAVIVSSVISSAVCVLTDSVAAMATALVVTLAVTIVPVVRWWLKAARAAGVPKTDVTPSRVVTGLIAMLAIVVSLGLEVAAFDATQSFIVEALVALAGAVVVAAVTAKGFASMPAGNAASAALLRMSAITSTICVPIFGANLWLQAMTTHPPYAFGSVVHSSIVAGFFLLVPLNAVNAYRYWRRWKSSQTPGATPTFT